MATGTSPNQSPAASSENVAMTIASLHRLPTLGEVLGKVAKPPVDLFSFYIYMRDQQKSVDYLDFWLDVSQHLELCRHYVSGLRRSVLFETPELDKAGSQRSSRVLDAFDPQERRSIDSDKSQAQKISSLLRSASNNNTGTEGKNSTANATGSAERLRSAGDTGNTPEFSRGPSDQPPVPPTRSSELEALPRPSFMTSNFGGDNNSPGQYSSPRTEVKRADIRASAEKILFTYVLDGAERQIVLPPQIQSHITQSIEDHGRDDPEVFDDAKDYVFQAMERDAFPGFLASKALGNLVPTSKIIRLVFGLISLFTAFWAAFILIFLDKDRATRCWIILPFTLAIYFLMTHQYALDPVLAFAKRSEYTVFKFVPMKEEFVIKLLRKRALIVLAWVLLIDVALICLFVFVPGKRL